MDSARPSKAHFEHSESFGLHSVAVRHGNNRQQGRAECEARVIKKGRNTLYQIVQEALTKCSANLHSRLEMRLASSSAVHSSSAATFFYGELLKAIRQNRQRVRNTINRNSESNISDTLSLITAFDQLILSYIYIIIILFRCNVITYHQTPFLVSPALMMLTAATLPENSELMTPIDLNKHSGKSSQKAHRLATSQIRTLGLAYDQTHRMQQR